MPLKNKKSNASYSYSDNTIENKDTNNNSVAKKVPFSVVEAYKTIRTNLMFVLGNSGGKVIALSSSNASEGKSTTSVNVAIAFSQLGGKVLLIDADLRRSSIHKKLKLDNTIGISSVLAGFNSFEDVVKPLNANLDILTAGPIPPNPSELLGSVALEDLIAHLKTVYDYIIIDTPPINIVSDALVIAPKTDGLILVVRDAYTPHDSIKRAMAAAEFANINVLGAIMNASNPKSSKRYSYRRYSYGYKYGYRYGYGYNKSDYSYEAKEK